MKQAFSAAFGPLCFWGNPLWSVLGFAVWFMLIGKEVHTPLPALLGVEQDFWKVADTSFIIWELLPEPSLSILRLSAWRECVGMLSLYLLRCFGLFYLYWMWSRHSRQTSLLPGECSWPWPGRKEVLSSCTELTHLLLSPPCRRGFSTSRSAS